MSTHLQRHDDPCRDEPLSEAFLHSGTVSPDHVQLPWLVGPRAFKGLWLALAALCSALLALAATVAGRVL